MISEISDSPDNCYEKDSIVNIAHEATSKCSDCTYITDYIEKMGSLQMDCNHMSKYVYDNYNYINLSVSKFFKCSIGIVYDLIQAYVKYKTNNEEFIKEIDKSIHNSSSNDCAAYKLNTARNIFYNMKIPDGCCENNNVDLYDFINIMIKAFGGSTDPALVLDYKNYMDKVGELRLEYNNDCNNLVSFDVENATEFESEKNECSWINGDSFVFKLRPHIINANKFNTYSTNINTVGLGWKVLLDMKECVKMILSYSELDEKQIDILLSTSRDDFIINELVKYTSVIEDCSRDIALELVNNSKYSEMNYSKFIEKLNKVYEKCTEDMDNIKLMKFAKLKYSGISTDVVTNIRTNPFTAGVDFNNLQKTADDVLDKLNSYDCDEKFIYKLYEAVSNSICFSKCNELDKADETSLILEKMSSIILNNAYIHYFEDTCRLYIDKKWDKNGQSSKELYVVGYTKEFNCKYNVNSLSEYLGTIEDIPAREFFIDAAKKILSIKCYPYYAHNNDKTGRDNDVFLYSKYKRLIWIYITSEFIYLSKVAKLLPNLGTLVDEDNSYKSNTPEKMFKETFKSLLREVFNISSNNGVCNYSSNRKFEFTDNYMSSDVMKKIKYMSLFINRYIYGCKESNRNDGNVSDRLLKSINDKLYDKNFQLRNSNFNNKKVFVYDISEIKNAIFFEESDTYDEVPSNDDIIDNIRKLLNSRDLI